MHLVVSLLAAAAENNLGIHMFHSHCFTPISDLSVGTVRKLLAFGFDVNAVDKVNDLQQIVHQHPVSSRKGARPSWWHPELGTLTWLSICFAWELTSTLLMG